MPSLLEQIRAAVSDDRFVILTHAQVRIEERRVMTWQIIAGLDDATLLRERPADRPFPSVVVRQSLPDGAAVEVVWSYSEQTQQARLVTVYFR